MKKRIIASLLTASMLAAALAGCGGSTAQTADTSADAAGEAESAQGDPATVTEKETNVSATADADLSGTTITFWHSMSGVNGEALTALVDRFNEENTYGITVDAEFEGEYDDAINKLKSSMVGGSGPDLVGSAADTAGLNLQRRHHVLHRLLKNLKGILPRLLADNIKSTVHDLLGNALLTVVHDVVDQTGHALGIIKRIGQNITFCNITSSWHFTSLLHNNDITGTRKRQTPVGLRGVIYVKRH